MWFESLKTIHTGSFIHAFIACGWGGEPSRQGPPLPRAGTTSRTSHCKYHAGSLTSVLGRVFPPVPGAQRPSSYLIFSPYLGLPDRDSPPWWQSRQRPGKCGVGGCPHPSPRSTKDTRWQTFLVIDPGRAGNPAPAPPCLGRTEASLTFQHPWLKASWAATASGLKT